MLTARQRIEDTRRFLARIPRTTVTLQWSDNLVFWTLSKAVGGKIFAVMPAEPQGQSVLAFAAGPVRMPQLLEVDGVIPAPYFARAHWVALQDWNVLPAKQLEVELRAAHTYVFDRMPPRTQRIQQLPLNEYRSLIRERASAKKR